MREISTKHEVEEEAETEESLPHNEIFQEQREAIETPENEMTGRVREAREWTKAQFNKLGDLIKDDVRLNEEMFEKLSPQIEENRRQAIEEKYNDVLALLKKSEDTEKYFDEKFDELERLGELKIENFTNVKAEEFSALTPTEKAILKNRGLLEQQIGNTEDPEQLLEWAKIKGPYTKRVALRS